MGQSNFQRKVSEGIHDLIWVLKEGRGLAEKKVVETFQAAKMFRGSEIQMCSVS